MASARSLANLYRVGPSGLPSGIPTGLTGPTTQGGSAAPGLLSPQATGSSGLSYDGASTGRRNINWQPSRLGPTSSLWSTLDLMRARCRDEIRNNPYAASACDNFEAQVVGDGIFPHWNIENKDLKALIEKKFDNWAKRTQFYVKQATAAREIFESGEIFCRFHVRPTSWGLKVPLDIQLIEGEQIPVFLNSLNGGQDVPTENSVRTGIEFDPFNRITAYHMYKNHPGETMLYPMDGLRYIRVPASEVVHAFKPLRAGLLRGVPHLSAVLTLLHEIGKYTDAAVVKKQIQTMFAGFIEKVSPDTDILPPDTSGGTNSVDQSLAPPLAGSYDSQSQNSKIETGTFQVLFPGEKITFPTLPQDSDIETFLSVVLHQFAAGCGATYEQITGDLKGVSLSSIRYGVQVMQRKCTQFQKFVMISQFLQPIVCRWMNEAVLAGELKLPGYMQDPDQYLDVSWRTPGWPYMQPMEDAGAAILRIRAGLSSREQEAANTGNDASLIDRQNVADQEREDQNHLVYESNASRVLARGQKLTAEAEADTGGVASVKPNQSEAPSENPPPAPVIAPPGPTKPAGKSNGKPS